VKPYVVGLIVVVAVLGGFYGGFKVGQNNVTANASAQTATGNRTGGVNGFGGGRNGFGGAACPSPGAPSPSPGTNAVAAGTISSLTSSSFVIAETNCEVKIDYGNTVQVSKNVAGTTSDLQDNTAITVIGTRQADGSIKANTIQIGTAGRGFGNPGGAQATPGAG
jgi:hypothetical protein